MKKHLVWFRSDLRLHDHPALQLASQDADHLVAVYIKCPQQDEIHHRGKRQLEFIEQNLQSLKISLQQNQVELHILDCAAYTEVAPLLRRFIQQHQITALYAHHESGVNEARRDQQVMQQIGIPFHILNGDCIITPGHVLTSDKTMFRVFTAFRNAWMKQLQHTGFTLTPLPATFKAGVNEACQNREAHWPAGEKNALDQLQAFCLQYLVEYDEQRDFPELDATSRLSPYLAIGAISAKQCLHGIQITLGYLPQSPGEKGFAWLNELVWREFYRHLMHAYPQISKNSCFKADMNRLHWLQDEQLFESWCMGLTGYPIVDAAMRCLKQTGRMHNRLRMIVASFLTKDLQIDWRRGEQYFMQQLIDADFASNNGGWQWAAGTGADAAPYFRIFNPTLQGEKFDARGRFIKQWIPELKMVPEKFIHKPHKWFKSKHITSRYPEPIVDHAIARKQTLLRYQTIPGSSI